MSKNKIQKQAEQKAQELYNEAMVCSKMAAKHDRKNFEGIKSKFWKIVSKLEKIHREKPTLISNDQKRKLDQAKMKF